MYSRQETPRPAWRDCRDPVRFHFILEVLDRLVVNGIDISLTRKPKDFPIPAHLADHPYILELGSNALPG